MDGDPHFRLKAFAVLTCVVGVFLLAFVVQRAWYWLKSKRREDIETTPLKPVIDISCLVIGGIVVWFAIEFLVLAIRTQHLPMQPGAPAKIAEIEVGKYEPETGQLNLLFYPVDRAGRRLSDQRLPVLTSGDRFELRVELVEWRRGLAWLGEAGFYQFISLGGVHDDIAQRSEVTVLQLSEVPRTLGAQMMLRPSEPREVQQAGAQGVVYHVILDPHNNWLSIESNQDPGP
jgi:hypothetical protein